MCLSCSKCSLKAISINSNRKERRHILFIWFPYYKYFLKSMSPFCLANIRHSLGCGITARLKSQFYYLLSMWPWTNHSTSLCFNSLIYKIRTPILSTSYFVYNFCENSTKQCTVLQIQLRPHCFQLLLVSTILNALKNVCIWKLWLIAHRKSDWT